MTELVPDIATRTNTQVTNLIVGPMGTFTSRVWDVHTHSLLKGIISHAFRKLSASMSFYMCGEGRAAPSWYMYVLGHANIFVSLNYMNLVLYNFPSLHNNERDRKYNDLLAKHDRDMIQIRREIDMKQDRPHKRRRDDEMEIPAIRVDADDDVVVVDRAEMDMKHNGDPDGVVEVVVDAADDDDLIRPPVVVRTVNVFRIGGGTIDVPVYVREYDSELRPRLSSIERHIYDTKEITRLQNGPWVDMDMTQMLYKDFKRLEIPRELWKKYRLSS